MDTTCDWLRGGFESFHTGKPYCRRESHTPSDIWVFRQIHCVLWCFNLLYKMSKGQRGRGGIILPTTKWPIPGSVTAAGYM